MSRSWSRFLAIAGALALAPSLVAAQQPATVQGRVQTETGLPIVSASVVIEQMSLGTTTRDDGTYSFTIPAGRVQNQSVEITARRIGFSPQTQRITLRPGTITQNFTLSETALQLEEVVVTGAGTQTTREKLANVINSVDGGEIVRSAEPNVVQALAGKAPNVIVNQASGEPGASSYIRIRGAKSIQGTQQPLFVVDGVPIDNSTFTTVSEFGPTGGTVAANRASDINPHDIESVEILKGSAAAAIYGARAAQGVVLITTKRGRPGETRWSLQSMASADEVSNNIPLQQRFGQGAGGLPAECPELNCRPVSTSYGPELAPGTRTYDHFDELFDTGTTFDNVLSVSGGSDRTLFFASLGNMQQNGVIIGPNNKYRRTTARLNASHRLLDDLTIGGNFAYTDVEGDFVQKGSNISGLMLGALRTPPEFNNAEWIDPETGLHRSYRFPRPGPTSLREHRGYDNPFFVALAHRNEEELGRAFGNLNLDYAPTDWLNVRYSLGGDYYSDWRLSALPLTASGGLAAGEGTIERTDIINYSIDHNLTATGQWEFNPDMAGTLTIGQNLNSRRYRQSYTAGLTLIAPEPFALQNTVIQQPEEFRSLVHTESYFAQGTLDLFEQLFLTAGARNDGFSTFGDSKRRFWFPKASAAWIFSRAMGIEDERGAFSFGKLRLAYGETGKEPEVYQTITALSDDRRLISGWGDFTDYTQGGIGGLVSDDLLGNDDLRPERTRETEVGLDLGFLDQRLDLSVTYYNARSSDVILTAPQAPSTGFFFRLENAARIRNRGVEATLNVRPITNPTFAWNVGLQWSQNKSKVLDLRGAEFVDKSDGSFAGSYGSVTKGEQVGVIRGEDFYRCGRGSVADIDGDGAEENVDDAYCQGAPSGALIIGPDGFPIYDPTDRVIADPNPDWLGSIRNTFTFFGRLQVSALLDIREGGQVWNGTKGALYSFGTHKDTEIRGQTRTFGQDFFRGPVAGPGAGTPVVIDEFWYTVGPGGGFTGPASQFIEDGSFVKLREISLTYTMDQGFVQRFGLSSIDLRVAGRNLATWTDYTGADPETNLGGAEVFIQGIDYFNNPQTRSYLVSLTLNR